MASAATNAASTSLSGGVMDCDNIAESACTQLSIDL
jgi:hypothetical protein